MNERLGIVEALEGRRTTFADRHPALARFFQGKGPRYDKPNVHRITVDCRTGARTVEQIAKEIVTDPAYASMPTIGNIMKLQAIAKAAPAMPAFVMTKTPSGRPQRKLTPNFTSATIDIVCEVWSVKAVKLMSAERSRRIAYPRFAAFLLIRERSGVSLPQIARTFTRDHTSVMHGIRVARELLETDPAWRANYDRAQALLDAATRGTGEKPASGAP